MSKLYNFDKKINRRNTNSFKWDTNKNEATIPMWVADMDFQTAPIIIENLEKRVQHGIFGYPIIPHSYYEAEQYWWKSRYNIDIETSWIQFAPGVLAAMSATIKALTVPGDSVLTFSPVFQYFYTCIINNQCNVVISELKVDNETEKFVFDFQDLEQKIIDNKVKIAMLCNPHNPVTRAWSQEELVRIVEICQKYNVIIMSDEIHRDFVFGDNTYFSLIEIGRNYLNNIIIYTAPTKAFNLAGLHVANMIIPNEKLRKKIDRAQNDNETAEPNIFGVEALISAYSQQGADWFDNLKNYIAKNISIFEQGISNMSLLKIVPLEATYLVFVDVSKTGLTGNEFCTQFLETENVRISSGEVYGTNSKSYVRFNLACQTSVVIDVLQRLTRFINSLDREK